MRTSAIIRTFIGVCAVGAALAAITSSVVSAQSANMAVSASVAPKCTVSAASISFPAYDPVVTNATNALTGTGNVSVACTKGVAPRIGLNLGSYSSGTTRQLANGSERLAYQLFKDTSGTAWGSASGEELTATAAVSRTARDFTVYGQIAGGQDVAAGAYTDTVVATVNF